LSIASNPATYGTVKDVGASRVCQAILVTIDQGLEEDASHQREDGGVGTDAERQCQNHSDHQPWSAN